MIGKNKELLLISAKVRNHYKKLLQTLWKFPELMKNK